MTKEELNKKTINISSVIYHNLQLVRQSVVELDFILNNPLMMVQFPLFGFPPYYGTNLIDIHGRNATILLHSLIKGDVSIAKLINVLLSNIDYVECKAQKKEMRTCLAKARNDLSTTSRENIERLSACRDKISAHQDKINAGPLSKIAEATYPFSDMKQLLERLEQIFAYIYYPLTGKKYEIYPEKSFVKEALEYLAKDKATH